MVSHNPENPERVVVRDITSLDECTSTRDRMQREGRPQFCNEYEDVIVLMNTATKQKLDISPQRILNHIRHIRGLYHLKNSLSPEQLEQSAHLVNALNSMHEIQDNRLARKTVVAHLTLSFPQDVVARKRQLLAEFKIKHDAENDLIKRLKVINQILFAEHNRAQP